MFGDVGESAVIESVGGQEETGGGVRTGGGACRVLQCGGDLAHAGEHLDVAVGQGVYAGGQGAGSDGQLADAFLQPADVGGQIGGGTEGLERGVHGGDGVLNFGEGAGHSGISGRIIAVAQCSYLGEESVVAQGNQDRDLVTDLGAFGGRHTPWGGVEGARQRVQDTDGVLGALGQGTDAGAGLDGLIHTGCGGRELLQQWAETLQAGAGGGGLSEHTAQGSHGGAHGGVELGEAVGELVGPVGQGVQVGASGVGVGHRLGHLVADLPILPGQLGLLQAGARGSGDTGDRDDAGHLGDAGGHFVEVGQPFGGAHVGRVLHDEEFGQDHVSAKVPVEQLVALVAGGAGGLARAVVVADGHRGGRGGQ
ncbi:Uncharacterised protein [Mycobacteroides abscessus subsp. abscessus]|nr:Uncharacterised protein [Mycobacteroides abscessus subsp. abscessus]